MRTKCRFGGIGHFTNQNTLQLKLHLQVHVSTSATRDTTELIGVHKCRHRSVNLLQGDSGPSPIGQARHRNRPEFGNILNTTATIFGNEDGVSRSKDVRPSRGLSTAFQKQGQKTGGPKIHPFPLSCFPTIGTSSRGRLKLTVKEHQHFRIYTGLAPVSSGINGQAVLINTDLTGNHLRRQSVNRDPEAAQSRKDRFSTTMKHTILKDSMDLLKVFTANPLENTALINTPIRTDALLPGSYTVTLVLFTLTQAEFLKVRQQRRDNRRIKQIKRSGARDARGKIKQGAGHLSGSANGRGVSKMTTSKLTELTLSFVQASLFKS